MRVLVQRVDETFIRIDGKIQASSGKGLLLFVGFKNGDTEDMIPHFADKIIGLRIFEDDEGKMNRSVKEINGEISVVSQFTLYADTNRGKRPGFSDSASPDIAVKLYNIFVKYLKESGLKIAEGVFGAHMEIGLINNGPATFLIEK